MNLEIGSRIEAFRLAERIGRGATGEVFRAEHTELGRQVAIKVLLNEIAGDHGRRQRFVREAWLANRFQHDHSVEVYDLRTLPDGRPYVVMEYVHGSNLYGLWDNGGKLELPRLLDVMVQIADALSSAHRACVLHRDLKPSNIYLTCRNGRRDYVKILDFGVGKLAGAVDDGLTATGEVLATPPYMSPEQATGEVLDGRTDLYSLGVIMWELLVGRRPFVGKTFGEYALLHATRPVQPPSTAECSKVVGGTYPRGLDAIVLRCMAKRPEDRYASAEELRAALEQLLIKSTPKAAEPSPSARPVRRVHPVAVGAVIFLLAANWMALRSKRARVVPNAAASTSVPSAPAPLRASNDPPAPTAGSPVPEPAAGRDLPAAPMRGGKITGLGMTIRRAAPRVRRHEPVNAHVLKDLGEEPLPP